jgi:hypothetical protein
MLRLIHCFCLCLLDASGVNLGWMMHEIWLILQATIGAINRNRLHQVVLLAAEEFPKNQLWRMSVLLFRYADLFSVVLHPKSTAISPTKSNEISCAC